MSAVIKHKNFPLKGLLAILLCFLMGFCFSACEDKPTPDTMQEYKMAFNHVISVIDDYIQSIENGTANLNFEEDQTECPTCKLKRIQKFSRFFILSANLDNYPQSTDGIPITVTLNNPNEMHYSFNGKITFGFENDKFFCTLAFAAQQNPSADNFQFYRLDLEYNSQTKTFGNFISQFYISGENARLNYITANNGDLSLLSKTSQSYQEKFDDYAENGYTNFINQQTTGTTFDLSQQYKEAYGVS